MLQYRLEESGQSEDVCSSPTISDQPTAALPGSYRYYKRKSTGDAENRALELMDLVEEKLHRSGNTRKEDKYDLFGKYIADKLRSMDPTQSKFAERLISEVLFEAEMGTINRDHKLIEVGTMPNVMQTK